jgi:hypothetical protein
MSTKTKRWARTCILCLVAVAPASAAERWLHLRVAESGPGAEGISINVPLSAVSGLLSGITAGGLDGGMLHLNDGNLDGVDLRQILVALRDTGDSVFVKVDGADETIRVAKERGRLLVNVDDGDDKVRLRIPLAVAEALVGNDPETLDVAAALRALEEFDGEDLVVVESEDESVRIWVDSSEAGR